MSSKSQNNKNINRRCDPSLFKTECVVLSDGGVGKVEKVEKGLNKLTKLGVEKKEKVTKEKKEKVKKESKPKKEKVQHTVEPFIISSSYIEQLKRERFTRNKDDPRTIQNMQRTLAFEKFENKEKLHSNLMCTKACKRVLKREHHKSYGVCNYPDCSFAHSLQQFRFADCVFGEYCRKPDCGFKHASESAAEYCKRTGKTIPDLPETHEQSYQPKPFVKRDNQSRQETNKEKNEKKIRPVFKPVRPVIPKRNFNKENSRFYKK